jgi:hypothetical protein
MAYIIDLTLVMQIIFCLADGKYPTSRRLIKAAVKSYVDSNFKETMHNKVRNHVKEAKVYMSKTRDTTLEKIIDLVNSYPMNPDQMSALTGGISWPSTPAQDEPWGPTGESTRSD